MSGYEVFKTYAFTENDPYPILIDTFFDEGAWWLIASWMANRESGVRVPERLVQLSSLPFEEVKGKPFRFLIGKVLPRSVLDGKPQVGFIVKKHKYFRPGPTPPGLKPT